MNEWNELVNELWSVDCNTVNPRKFLKCFLLEVRDKDKYFMDFIRIDIDLFLTILMEFLHNSLKKVLILL